MSLQDSAELLEVIKSRGTVPVNAGSWTDARLLRTASEVIRTWHLPLLVAAQGEYLVKETQMACVAGQREYLISYRAAAVRLLSLLGQDHIERPLNDLTPTAQSDMGVDRSRRGQPNFFNFREGYVQLFPLPMSITDSLKVLWHIRPSRIVETSECRQIKQALVDNPSAGYTRIELGDSSGSVATAPTGFASAPGGLFDFVGVRNPFPVKGFDVSKQSLITAGVSTTIDFLTADLPTGLLTGANGDWICVAGKTAVPNVPEELHVPVALRTGAAAVGSRQSQLAMALNAEAAALEKNLLAGILQPRSKGNVKRLVQRRWMRS